jgi:hypothetical protein
MITKEYDEKIKYHRKDLMNLVISFGTISAATILLVFLITIDSQSSLDIEFLHKNKIMTLIH